MRSQCSPLINTLRIGVAFCAVAVVAWAYISGFRGHLSLLIANSTSSEIRVEVAAGAATERLDLSPGQSQGIRLALRRGNEIVIVARPTRGDEIRGSANLSFGYSEVAGAAEITSTEIQFNLTPIIPRD